MYCTLADISPVVTAEKIEEIIDSGNGGVSKTTINDFIAYADRKINTALGSIYKIPITGDQSLEVIKSISIALTIEAVYNLNEDGKVPDRIKQEADFAREELKAYGGAEGSKPWKALPDAPKHFGMSIKSVSSCEAGQVFGD